MIKVHNYKIIERLDRIEYLLKEEIEAREGLLENPALFSFFGEDPASDVFEFSSFSVCEFESFASPIGSNNYSVYETLSNIILAIIYIAIAAATIIIAPNFTYFHHSRFLTFLV